MRRRPLIVFALAVAVLAAAGAAGYRFALQRLQGAVLEALGPRASVASIEVEGTGVAIRGLRIAGERGGPLRWPADDELRAEHVRVLPDLRSAFGGGAWRVQSIEVQGGYLSLLRSRDGRLHVLPALLERGAAGASVAASAPASTSVAASAPAPAAPLLQVGEVRLVDAVVEFHDASVRHPAHRLRLAQLNATLGRLALPALDSEMPLALKAVFKGPQRDGRLAIDGTLQLARRDANLAVRLAGVDLVALQPYLLKVAEGGVKRGSLDLRLDATVQRNHLRAPGSVTLTGLELGSGGGVLGTFAGVPRQAVLAAMSRRGRIELKFTLDGRLDDPAFSLNENLATRVGSGLAEALGVSLGGLVEGVGSVIKGLFGR